MTVLSTSEVFHRWTPESIILGKIQVAITNINNSTTKIVKDFRLFIKIDTIKVMRDIQPIWVLILWFGEKHKLYLSL